MMAWYDGVRRLSGRAAVAAWALGLLAGPAAAQTPPPSDVTFSKDIAPILQRSCQTCHRPDGVAPMSLVTYEEVRPWARAIKQRTGLGPRAGVMPPWYIEKNIGIQHYKDDPSLSEAEIAKVAKWADTRRAARQSRRRAGAAAVFGDGGDWRIGKPDLVVSSDEIAGQGQRARLVGRDRRAFRPA